MEPKVTETFSLLIPVSLRGEMAPFVPASSPSPPSSSSSSLPPPSRIRHKRSASEGASLSPSPSPSLPPPPLHPTSVSEGPSTDTLLTSSTPFSSRDHHFTPGKEGVGSEPSRGASLLKGRSSPGRTKGKSSAMQPGYAATCHLRKNNNSEEQSLVNVSAIASLLLDTFGAVLKSVEY